jgi:hypothetical protein
VVVYFLVDLVCLDNFEEQRLAEPLQVSKPVVEFAEVEPDLVATVEEEHPDRKVVEKELPVELAYLGIPYLDRA